MILTGAELSKYFGKETTPREMKDQIIKLLDDWKGQQKEHEKPEKKTNRKSKPKLRVNVARGLRALPVPRSSGDINYSPSPVIP